MLDNLEDATNLLETLLFNTLKTTYMKKLLLSILFILPFTFVQAQSNNVTIKGTVVDTAGTALGFSSVLLLMPADSALVTYVLANDKGEFTFKNVARKPYLLKATFVSYLPYQELIEPTDADVFTVENVALRPLIRELYEVVIKTAKAPISIKGDTVEYDATKFKVPPGSTVEDLLRKLPGVEVLQDGTVQAQGEEVRQVTVDGKRFFGGDPKMATKNLGADAVKKVQIYNGKSEQAKLTGIDDGKREKSMNLELKEDAKRGGFGKVTAGIGTNDRAMLSGNYNKFDAKNQFSVVGFGNNVNQTGMSFDDYQDFRGSNAFRWNDDADFGFSGGGGMRIVTFGDDDSESFSIPIGGRAGDGFSNNAAGGINYNYNHEKTELSSSYFYNQTRQTLDAVQIRENFLNNNQSFINNNNSNQLNFSGNHRASLRLSKELDSLNTFTLIGNGRLSNRDINLNSSQEFIRQNEVTNRTTIDNSSDRLSYAFAGTGIYRLKFKKKKKRNIAVSGTYNLSKSDDEARQNSINEFLQALNTNESLIKINQLNNTASQTSAVKSSLLFIEPVGKKFYWESFYNLNLRDDEVDRSVFDKLDAGNVRNNTLSRYYTNRILYNRLGTGIRYSYKGLNFSAGLAAQRFDITGDVAVTKESSIISTTNRSFQSIVPNVDASYSMKNNRYLRMDYSVGVNAPRVNDLQPIIDNSNPLFITQGNPELLPETAHNISVSFNQFDPANFTNSFLSLNYSYNINQIVYNQTVDPQTLITSTQPINISGGQNIGGYGSFGFPIVKTKLTFNVNGNVNFGKYLSFVNDVLNTTQTDRYNIGTRVSLTPIDWFTFYLRTSWGVGNTKYSINTTQNQQILNSSYSGEMNMQLPKSFFFSTNLNYQIYKNERFGFDQNLPILGAAIWKQFGEKKRAEVRFSAYDILNKNQGISQNASQNFISTRQVETLAQYFMLSFTYNMRGVEGNIRKRYF